MAANFNTRQAIPHIHYFGLRRVTTTKGLYITKLCEDKISVSTDVKNETDRLRTQGRLQLTTSPMTTCDNVINVCFLNARSLHKHIGDICNDLYCKNSDVCMFLETIFHHRDTNSMYTINGYHLYRNDAYSLNTSRPYGGTAIYIAELSSCLDIPLKYQWHRSNYCQTDDPSKCKHLRCV